MNPDVLKNKVIWLTGASRGIGKAIAEQLISYEAKLVLSATSEESFLPLSKNPEFKKATFLPFDIGSVPMIEKAYEQIKYIYGKVDILINNAGIAIFKKLHHTTEEEFDEMLSIILKGSFFTTKAVLTEMLEQKSGMIVNISSVSVEKAYKNCSAYSAAKAGMLMMSQCLREEVRDFGIKVIDIIPGATLTEIWSEEARTDFSSKMMKPEDIASTVISTIINSINERTMIEKVVIRPQTGDL